MAQDLLPVKGSPGSPYTRKMLAVLRYRRIPYRYIQGGHGVEDDLPQPKVQLIPIFYFPDGHGGLSAEVDSSPIIRRLEDEYPGRSIIPDDPAMAFIDALLEDYGDEWLTKAMFHYRWYYDADIDMAGGILPHYGNLSMPDEQLKAMKKMISERQIGRLYVVGSNDTTASVIEDSYKRFLGYLNEHLKSHPFIMGQRPGSADFGCFGQLTQLTQFDPTPSQVAIAGYPRIHAWVSKMEDHSGWEPHADGFIAADAVPESMKELLKEVGRTYVPVMLANGLALDQGLDRVETVVSGKAWEQEPFPYQGKCLQWLRIAYARLSKDERGRVDTILTDTGCEALVEGMSADEG